MALEKTYEEWCDYFIRMKDAARENYKLSGSGAYELAALVKVKKAVQKLVEEGDSRDFDELIVQINGKPGTKKPKEIKEDPETSNYLRLKKWLDIRLPSQELMDSLIEGGFSEARMIKK